MSPKPVRTRGFTLIELLIVIIIIAIMAAIIVPAYVRFLAHARFRENVREVQDLFAYAREQALELDTEVTLVYNAQSASFSVTLPSPPPDTDKPVSMGGSGSSAENDPTSGVTPVPRTAQLSSDEVVSRYNVSASHVASVSPSATVPGVDTSSGSNDLHFQPDATVEGLEMDITQSDGAHAHLVLSPSTAKLKLDVGASL